MSSLRQFFKPGTTVLLAGFDASVTDGQLKTVYPDDQMQIVPALLAAGTLFGGNIDTGGSEFPGLVTADGYDSLNLTARDTIIGYGKFPDQIEFVWVKRHTHDDIATLFLIKCSRERFNLHNRRGRHANPGRDFKRLLLIDQDIRWRISTLREFNNSVHETLRTSDQKTA